MKYLFSLLIAVTLMGAGCSQAANVEIQTSPDTQKQEQTSPNTEESGVEDTQETDTETEAVIEIETDTGTLEVKENTTTQTQEEGVPVTEVTLGMDSDASMTMEAGNYFFTPSTITVAPGSNVKITFAKNAGFHTFVIDAIGLNFSVNEGESVLFTAPSEPGSYPFYCSVGSHRSFGMEGTLIVE